jgi:flagellar basal body-associated protein FliL
MAKKKEAPAEGTEATEEAKGSSKKMIIIGVVLMLGGVFAGKTFFGGGSGGTTQQIAVPVEKTTTVLDRAAAVAVTMDPVLVNLSDGHYLKMAFTVTITPEPGKAAEKVDLDALKPKYDKLRAEALSYLSGRTSVDVLGPRFIEEVQKHLMERSELWYGEGVSDIAVGDWVVS